MKAVKVRKDLLFTVAPLVILIAAAIIWFFPHAFKQALFLFWGVLAIALLCIVTPWGGRPLKIEGDTTRRYEPIPWLLRIIILQSCITAIYLGIAEISGQKIIALTRTHPHLFANTLYYFLCQLGLFPWALIGLIAVGMGYYAYRFKEDAYLSALSKPILQSKPQQTLGLIANTFAKQGTLMSLATTFAFFSLLLASLVSTKKFPILSGFEPTTAFLVLLLLVFSVTKLFKRYLSRILSEKIPLFLSMFLMCLLLAGVILLLSAIFIGIGSVPAKLPNIIMQLKQKNWNTLWLLFSVMWWLGWTPVLAAHIARLSRGYTIRQIMIGVLILPAIVSVLFYLGQHAGFMLSGHHPTITAIITIIGFIGFCGMVTQHDLLPMMLLSYLPKQDDYKRRDHYFFFRKSLQLAIAVFYLFLPTGIAATSILVFIVSFPIAITLLIAVIALVVMLWKDRSDKNG